jgi:hypothetical protein
VATMAAPHINYSNYPLKDISQPHPHDVLCGRGGGTNNHIGNSHWRMLVAANKQLYITLPKRQKMLLSRSIVNAVRSQTPSGRFLQKDSKSNLWFDVGDQKAQEKTSQALREGAPDIRKKVAGETEEDGTGEFGTHATEEKNNSGESSDEEGEIEKNTLDRDDNVDEMKTSKKETTEETPSSSSGPDGTTKVAAPARKDISNSVDSILPPQSTQLPAILSGTMQYNTSGTSGMHGSGSDGSYGCLPHFNSTTSAHQQAMMAQFAAQQMNMTTSNVGVNMRLYPTMVLNEHGILVPGMSVLPHPSIAVSQMYPQMNTAGSTIPQAYQTQQQRSIQQEMQQLYQQQQRRQQGTDDDGFGPLPVINHNSQLHPHDSSSTFGVENCFNINSNINHQHYQAMMNRNNKTKMTPTFDEYVAAPEGLVHGGLSFGSAAMTDSEKDRPPAASGTATETSSFHTRQLPMRSITHSNNVNTNHHHYQRQQQHRNESDPELPIPAGLEPTGISFGDISMMSTGTNHNMKLEDTGPSFGTMMSYNTMNPTAVDFGLEAIGTSFGSLSIDASNRDTLFRSLELAAAGPEIPPMFPSEEKAHGNLLDCSDTDSENSEDQELLVQQKSQAWERMKSQIATETSLLPSGSRGSIASTDLMPPPIVPPKHHGFSPQMGRHPTLSESYQSNGGMYFVNTELAVPTTALENNFSTLSAWSAADDYDDIGGDEQTATGAPPPPLQLRKDDSW